MSVIHDFAVIGAGIAGASVAARLAAHAKVILLEMEAQPGYHTTGRSAALFTETYGPPPIRALTRASSSFFHNTPDTFSTTPLLSERGVLMTASANQMETLKTLIREVSSDTGVKSLSGAATQSIMPLLRKDYVAGAMFDHGAKDIDVNALHQGFLRQFKQSGGTISTSSPVQELTHDRTSWRIRTPHEEIQANTVLNAAGAWADELGKLAGATSIGLVPKRRTVLTVPHPKIDAEDNLPMVVDVDERFYLKPDAGQLLISPADETPSPPCDAQPEELDIAICIDRIQNAFDLQIGRIQNKWAGLRSFVSDKCPVCGFDPDVPNFFWLAGQGGYGIQTSPALSDLAAELAMGNPLPPYLANQGIKLDQLSPGRFQTGNDG